MGEKSINTQHENRSVSIEIKKSFRTSVTSAPNKKGFLFVFLLKLKTKNITNRKLLITLAAALLVVSLPFLVSASKSQISVQTNISSLLFKAESQINSESKAPILTEISNHLNQIDIVMADLRNINADEVYLFQLNAVKNKYLSHQIKITLVTSEADFLAARHNYAHEMLEPSAVLEILSLRLEIPQIFKMLSESLDVLAKATDVKNNNEIKIETFSELVTQTLNAVEKYSAVDKFNKGTKEFSEFVKENDEFFSESFFDVLNISNIDYERLIKKIASITTELKILVPLAASKLRFEKEVGVLKEEEAEDHGGRHSLASTGKIRGLVIFVRDWLLSEQGFANLKMPIADVRGIIEGLNRGVETSIDDMSYKQLEIKLEVCEVENTAMVRPDAKDATGKLDEAGKRALTSMALSLCENEKDANGVKFDLTQYPLIMIIAIWLR